VNAVVAVFWATKISRTIRIRKPKISDVHSAAARVNFTSSACTAGESVTIGGTDSPGVASVGWGSLLMRSS